MADRSPIEWTDATWNPIGGCNRVDAGCENCYAEIMAARFSGPGQWGEGLARIVKYPDGHADHRWTGKMVLHKAAINRPLHWKKPRKIFVNSTSDLFHKDVPDEWIDRVFAVMALAPQHIYQVLTKRPDRARAYFDGRIANFGRASEVLHEMDHPCSEDDIAWAADQLDLFDCMHRPMQQVWLGTSISDQKSADIRVPELLACPAAIRFLSCEPMLGRIRLSGVSEDGLRKWNWLTGETATMHPDGPDFDHGPKIDWVICGGESGPGARPMHPDHARDLRDQCQAAGVPFFHKQNGQWLHEAEAEAERWDWEDASERGLLHVWDDGTTSIRLRKADAGRLLDGRTWDEVPA